MFAFIAAPGVNNTVFCAIVPAPTFRREPAASTVRIAYKTEEINFSGTLSFVN